MFTNLLKNDLVRYRKICFMKNGIAGFYLTFVHIHIYQNDKVTSSSACGLGQVFYTLHTGVPFTLADNRSPAFFYRIDLKMKSLLTFRLYTTIYSYKYNVSKENDC